MELLLSSEGSKYMEDKELADEIITFMMAVRDTFFFHLIQFFFSLF